MSKLHELQCRFRDALLKDEINLITPLIQKGKLGVETRISIYRNNAFTNLREALRTIYPVINQLVSDVFFDYAADEFIRRYPSPAGDLNQYGEEFAVFLAEFPPAAELIYLPDVARLEWYGHRCYHAPEHASLDLEKLAALTADMYEQLRFIFNPASMLMESMYPVHRIWQMNQADYSGEHSIDLNEGGVRLLIQRQYGLIELQVLTDEEWVLLNALVANEDLTTAIDNAQRINPELDLGNFLAKFILQSTLVDFQLVTSHPLTN